ncbi:MAG: MoaD/ThiS family protein [Deltaproteobacteria bacterium]|jgi:molybdopterin converting factor small subunit|nr:MoaD/ThiS family protein [Deltaproteobacteria bacterium]
MSITLLMPTALRGFTDGKSEISLDGETVGQVLLALAKAYPDISTHLFDEAGELRSFINVFINGENAKSSGGLKRAVKDGETLMLVPAIAGGSANPLERGKL